MASSSASLKARTVSVLTDTVTIKFICGHCDKESTNEGVKRNPLPQWGLKCSHCGEQNGAGPYTQIDEFDTVLWEEKEQALEEKAA